MGYVGRILLLAAAIVGSLVLFAQAAGALHQGRLNDDTGRPVLVFRERPARFVAVLLMFLYIACGFAAVAVGLVCDLLG